MDDFGRPGFQRGFEGKGVESLNNMCGGGAVAGELVLKGLDRRGLYLDAKSAPIPSKLNSGKERTDS